MPINNLPASLQAAIQQGYLQREFEQSLRARLGWRAIADREPFMAGIGETITKTRAGLLAAATSPLAIAANTDITNGISPQTTPIEQYVLGIAQYGNGTDLNVATSRVAIANLFLNNAKALGENSLRSVDMLVVNAAFNAYLSGNTRVRTTLGAAGLTVSVDDIRGFQTVPQLGGIPAAVSPAIPLTVTVNGNGYSVVGAVADGTNVSTSPGGVSGTLTFSGNVSIADGTAGNAVVSSIAPQILRASATQGGPSVATSAAITPGLFNSGKLTINTLLAAKASLEANSVPPVEQSGLYRAFVDPIHMTGLYTDPVFQQFFRGQSQSEEYKRGKVAELLGMEVVTTHLSPVQALSGNNIRRAFVTGQGSIVEGAFTNAAYRAAADATVDDEAITVIDGIAHIVAEPIDRLKQVVRQSWSYIGGFAVPTDLTANPSVIPTASNSAFKRAVVVESL